MVKKEFIEIRLCNPMTCIFKRHVKIVKYTWWMKFNVSVLNRLNGFFVNTKYKHKHNAIFNKTVTRLAPILTKCFFPYLNPTSYLKLTSWRRRESKRNSPKTQTRFSYNFQISICIWNTFQKRCLFSSLLKVQFERKF